MGILREKCWIIQGRRAIRKIIKACVICRRFSATSASVPQAALPEDRVKDDQAFEVTGIDLAGPLVMKDKSKCWITLFTCAVYRCVHLEVVQSITTEDFLLAFIRFCRRKRRPDTIYTDNGTNFTGAENLCKMIDWNEVSKQTQLYKIKWRFNPPSAPWWGGWWERLIKSVKDLLKRMLGFRKVTYVELETLLCEEEAVINNRPLTYVTEDQDDLIPLTPAMFIHNLSVVDCPESKLIKIGTFCERRKNLHQLSQELKNRFRNEYLVQLVQRGKDQKFHAFQIGDVVLVQVDNKKRILWPMARIVELINGKDGVAFVAKLRTKCGMLLRPIQGLIPLEISYNDHFNTIPRTETKSTKKKLQLGDALDVKKS